MDLAEVEVELECLAPLIQVRLEGQVLEEQAMQDPMQMEEMGVRVFMVTRH